MKTGSSGKSLRSQWSGGRWGAMTGLVVCAVLLWGVVAPWGEVRAQTSEITVSAAASLKTVFEEIVRAFERKEKGAKVYVNFAASGDLKRQIEAGAPVDVFASAARREMDDLEQKNLIIPVTKRLFARNRMVLIRPAESGSAVGSFVDLAKPEVKRFAMGNPATVPAGMYGEEVLRYFKVLENVKEKLILGESVRQVLDYVARGEVDAGIVFATDAKVRAREVSVIELAPADSHSPAVYPIAVIKNTKNEALARAFAGYVFSAEAKAILANYGFEVFGGPKAK
jgi:molybdate transport system substrate-binding protein